MRRLAVGLLTLFVLGCQPGAQEGESEPVVMALGNGGQSVGLGREASTRDTVTGSVVVTTDDSTATIVTWWPGVPGADRYQHFGQYLDVNSEQAFAELIDGRPFMLRDRTSPDTVIVLLREGPTGLRVGVGAFDGRQFVGHPFDADGNILQLPAAGGAVESDSPQATPNVATTPTPPPPPPPAGTCGVPSTPGGNAGEYGYGNEPPGMTSLTHTDFGRATEHGDDNFGRRRYCLDGGILWRVGARGRRGGLRTEGSRTFMRTDLPANCCDGGSGGQKSEIGLPGVRELYVAWEGRLSPNWIGNGSGVQKVMAPTSPRDAIWVTYYGSGTKPIRLKTGNGPALDRENGCSLSDLPYGDDPNMWVNRRPIIHIQRGQWHTYELYVKYSTGPCNADGIIRQYIDGQLQIEVTDYVFGWGNDGRWMGVKAHFIWGGRCDVNNNKLGGCPPAAQWVDIDNWYVSGR